MLETVLQTEIQDALPTRQLIATTSYNDAASYKWASGSPLPQIKHLER
jgi:hypothetical protein